MASTSMEQGRRGDCCMPSDAYTAPNQHFPNGIYTIPEISTIGETEESLKKQGGINYVAGRYRTIGTFPTQPDHWRQGRIP